MKRTAHRGDNFYITIFERCMRSQPRIIADLLTRFNLKIERTRNYPWFEMVDAGR